MRLFLQHNNKESRIPKRVAIPLPPNNNSSNNNSTTGSFINETFVSLSPASANASMRASTPQQKRPTSTTQVQLFPPELVNQGLSE